MHYSSTMLFEGYGRTWVPSPVRPGRCPSMQLYSALFHCEVPLLRLPIAILELAQFVHFRLIERNSSSHALLAAMVSIPPFRASLKGPPIQFLSTVLLETQQSV